MQPRCIGSFLKVLEEVKGEENVRREDSRGEWGIDVGRWLRGLRGLMGGRYQILRSVVVAKIESIKAARAWGSRRGVSVVDGSLMDR